jgi:hypothetical protein
MKNKIIKIYYQIIIKNLIKLIEIKANMIRLKTNSFFKMLKSL